MEASLLRKIPHLSWSQPVAVSLKASDYASSTKTSNRFQNNEGSAFQSSLYVGEYRLSMALSQQDTFSWSRFLTSGSLVGMLSDGFPFTSVCSWNFILIQNKLYCLSASTSIARQTQRKIIFSFLLHTINLFFDAIEQRLPQFSLLLSPFSPFLANESIRTSSFAF